MKGRNLAPLLLMPSFALYSIQVKYQPGLG